MLYFYFNETLVRTIMIEQIHPHNEVASRASNDCFNWDKYTTWKKEILDKYFWLKLTEDQTFV